MENDSAKFRQEVSGADERGLGELVLQHLGAMPLEAALTVLRSPFVSRQVVEKLCSQASLMRSSAFRRQVAAHRVTGEVRALKLLPSLGWRDLIEVIGSVRVRQTVRRAASGHLSARLPGLAVGERVLVARRASPDLLKRLLLDFNLRVTRAILENPKLTELVLMTAISDPAATSGFLKEISDHPLWNRRRSVQRALCRNPRTPPVSASALLATIGKQDLRAVVADGRIAAVVKVKARTLLGEGGKGLLDS